MSDALIERLKLEAQSHAQEARTANATIAEIYQLCTEATGELGNRLPPAVLRCTQVCGNTQVFRVAGKRLHTAQDRRMMPIRIQLSRRKGWKMPAGTVKVDRSTKFGNPHTIVGSGREEAVARFERDLQRFGCIPSRSTSRDATTVGEIKRELCGKNLACWCPLPAPGEPDRCHAAILLRIANECF